MALVYKKLPDGSIEVTETTVLSTSAFDLQFQLDAATAQLARTIQQHKMLFAGQIVAQQTKVDDLAARLLIANQL